jgi:uncharacterized 2Fe-2S/4Fe-4S cluster protein (DUF4445 family)
MKFRVQFLPAGTIIEAEEGASLLETARRAGYALQTECGGLGTCRRCKVKLVSGQVFLAGRPNLSPAEREHHFILACLARVIEDVVVQIPAKSQFQLSREALQQEWSPGEHPGRELENRGHRLESLVSSVPVAITEPTQQDNASDYDRLCRSLGSMNYPPPYQTGVATLRKLPSSVRDHHGSLRALLTSDLGQVEIVDLRANDGLPVYGYVLDIGTTTLFARLLDLETGAVIAESSDFNPQIPYGADVIHRIIYAGKKEHAGVLRRLAVEAANALLERLLQAAKASREQVVAAVLAGNATMEHLFLGIDPANLRIEPYVPAVTHFPRLSAAESGLEILPQAPLLMCPSVASYVGGDITAGLLAAGVHLSEKLCLYVDLGTNGEVALGNRDWLTACACSAGPAFEGSGVRCGMRALPGAIDQVHTDATTGYLDLHVLGGGHPRGICGSGLIDLLAEMRATERITARGKLNPEADPARIRRAGKLHKFILAEESKAGGTEEIAIRETDLDNLIRTKAAIFAGIMTLLKGVGLEPGQIERVVIAGGFGLYLNILSAIRIGLLPDLPRERFEYIGNGSLRGAGLALLSRQAREELGEIASRVTYFELSTWPGYMDEFMAALFLPHTDRNLFPSFL